MRIILTIMICFLFIAGCKPSNSKIVNIAEKEISSAMKDPGSTKFSDIESKELFGVGTGGKTGYCVFGKVNGKNSFGAYSGNKPFAMTIVAESVLVPFLEPKYKVASMVIVNDDSDTIMYFALRKLCQ